MKIQQFVMLLILALATAACAGKDVPKGNNPQTKDIDVAQSDSSSDRSSISDIPILEDKSSNQVTAEQFQSIKTDEEKLTEENVASDVQLDAQAPRLYTYFFPTNSDELASDARQNLAIHAEYLKANPDTLINIKAHADVRGAREYNQKLSEQRAEKVIQELVQLGVDRAQILSSAHGEDIPLNDENNWKENRRVELQYVDNMMLSTRQ